MDSDSDDECTRRIRPHDIGAMSVAIPKLQNLVEKERDENKKLNDKLVDIENTLLIDNIDELKDEIREILNE